MSPTNPLDTVLDAIYRQTGKRPTGAGVGPFSARCPAHHDHHPSLVINQGYVRVVLHCHTGCSEEDILRVLGMELGDLYPRLDGMSSRNDIEGSRGNHSRDGEPSKPGLPNDLKDRKLPELYKQHQDFVEALPEDYFSDRNEYLDGWKCGWIQALHEWNSHVSLVGHRAKKSPNRDDIYIEPIIFWACRASAAAYRTKSGSWDAGKGSLLTYARNWATIPAIDAEIKNQLNGGGRTAPWAKVLDPDLVEGVPFENVEEFVVPPEIVTERICLECGEDISHRPLDAKFCTDQHRKSHHYRRDRIPADEVERTVMLVEGLTSLGAASTEDQKHERALLDYLAFIARKQRARIKRLEDFMTTKPDLAYVQEAVRINERRRTETQHLMTNWEQDVRRFLTLSHRRKTTEKKA